MHTLTTMAFLVTLLAGASASAGDEGKEKTLTGILRHDAKLEGGAWILDVEGMHYDLHGNLSGCSSGDTVEVEGRTSPEWVCYHMVGTVLKVTRVKVLRTREKGDRAWLLPGPLVAPERNPEWY